MSSQKTQKFEALSGREESAYLANIQQLVSLLSAITQTCHDNELYNVIAALSECLGIALLQLPAVERHSFIASIQTDLIALAARAANEIDETERTSVEDIR